MDHAALFNAVKSRDVEQLHKVLGPTLKGFGSYQIKYWDHAQDGVLTSLDAFPGLQGYDCLRWAEKTVQDSHRNRQSKAQDALYAEYVYKLRADLLGKAMERIPDLDASDREEFFWFRYVGNCRPQSGTGRGRPAW